MDVDFSAPVNVDGALVLEVIDDEWISDTLPVDDVEVPAAAAGPLDDDDGGSPSGDDVSGLETKWTDLALETFSSAE